MKDQARIPLVVGVVTLLWYLSMALAFIGGLVDWRGPVHMFGTFAVFFTSGFILGAKTK